MWLDGTTIPGRTAGAGDARQVTLFGDSPDQVARGPHAVVAFASTFADATALAWMFTYRGKSAGSSRGALRAGTRGAAAAAPGSSGGGLLSGRR